MRFCFRFGGTMKKPIDIEKLVQWALRDELPKGKAVSASAWDLLTQYGLLGTRVDVSRGSYDGMGFVPGSPHEDALAVAAAIQRLDDRGHLPDIDNALGLFGDLAPIAATCAASLLVADFNPRALVISKAISGGRPAWQFEQPTAYAMTVEFRDPQGAIRRRPLVHGVDADGVEVAMLPNRGGRAQRKGMYDFDMAPRSPLRWGDPDLMSIGHSRAEYVAWHTSLCALVDMLGDTLVEFAPTMPAARPLPWITGQVQPSRVLRVLDEAPVSTDILPVTPVRPASRRPTPHARHGKVFHLELVTA
jgi:hypothetical protein